MQMLVLIVAAALLQDSSTCDGRAKRVNVDIPRIDTVVAIDGVLDERVWKRAARLTGFSQYQPVDGLPAVHARLRRVVIEEMPALDLIRREDTPNTLYYCLPPGELIRRTTAFTDESSSAFLRRATSSSTGLEPGPKSS